jgi:hypothetical protein
VKIEIRRADWSVPYPANVDEKSVPGLLRPLTYVEHEIDAVPWHLADRMIGLLETPEASFDYLHLTEYLRARAAMLVIKGQVLNIHGLHTTLSKYQVQVGGIYRKHLLCFIRAFLKKHNMAQLPCCDMLMIDPLQDPKQTEKNRELIQRVIHAAETAYVNTLNFISEGPEMDERIAGESVEFWIKSQERHRIVDVRVRIFMHDGWYEVTVCPDEAKRLFRDGRTAGKYAVRLQEEFAFGREGSSQNSGDRRQAAKNGERDGDGDGRMGNGAPRATSGSGWMGKRDGHHGQKTETGINRRTECASHHGGRTGKRKMPACDDTTAMVAQRAAELALATVAPALRCSKLNPDRGATDDLVQAFALERRNHATDGETFSALARWDIETARKTPDKAPWMRLSDARRHYRRAVQGELLKQADIDMRVDALERRYRRAINSIKRGHTDK